MSRIEQQPGFILHQRPYRNTSLILEVLTLDFGRVGLVARGVRGGKKYSSAQLQTFRQLLLSWTGRGELHALTGIEEPVLDSSSPILSGQALFCAYYINELILYLLPRDDAQPQVFAIYSQALARLSSSAVDTESALRLFELLLLDSLGYQLELTRDVNSGDPIEAGETYCYVADIGPTLAGRPYMRGVVIHGATLLDLQRQDFTSTKTREEGKRLLRALIDHHLGGRRLKSRQMFRDLFGKTESRT